MYEVVKSIRGGLGYGRRYEENMTEGGGGPAWVLSRPERVCYVSTGPRRSLDMGGAKQVAPREGWILGYGVLVLTGIRAGQGNDNVARTSFDW